MHERRARLEPDAEPGRNQPPAEVDVLEPGRMEALVHAADRVERGRAHHQAGRRGLIDIQRRRVASHIEIAREIPARPGLPGHT